MKNKTGEGTTPKPIGKIAFYVSLSVGILAIIGTIVGAAVKITKDISKVEINNTDKIHNEIRQLNGNLSKKIESVDYKVGNVDKNLLELIQIYKNERRILKSLTKDKQDLRDLMPDKLDIPRK